MNKALRFLIVLVIFLFCTGILPAQNHMDIMTTMTGITVNTRMGWVMTTLDWNGDGYDDLIVNEISYKPINWSGLPLGALHIYFGGPNFDNIPEIEMPGNYELEFGHTISMCNAGHMNNDQYDDLALFKATRYEGNDHSNYDLQLCVYYGGANPDSIPYYILTFPREDWDNNIYLVNCLGDINHDGFDDLGYMVNPRSDPHPYTFGIIYGGNMTNTVFLEVGIQTNYAFLNGVGDVNADGYNDFMIGYSYQDNGSTYQKDVLYFGNDSGINNDSLIIANGSELNSPNSFPAGDVNEDGIDDFVSAFSNSHSKLFFGGISFDASHFVYLNPPYQGGIIGKGFGHGDVNGNGTDDLMGTTVSWSGGGGSAGFWEGGSHMNGGLDLFINHPEEAPSQMFGWCMTMGDYNGDGCCDAAISAPFEVDGSFAWNGKVYIYAGNTDLDDPTPITDNTNVPVANNGIKLYPNPLQPSESNLSIWFSPLPPSSRGVISSTFEIYNIRGQKVKSYLINVEQAKSGSASYNLNDLSSGVYVCVFTNREMQHKKKITLIK